ncbi:MAG: hypothetical protein NC418_02390 [Muribaculaceae bacterium]|nr:hypothetical protein [Muribaculaceae bacterium]
MTDDSGSIECGLRPLAVQLGTTYSKLRTLLSSAQSGGLLSMIATAEGTRITVSIAGASTRGGRGKKRPSTQTDIPTAELIAPKGFVKPSVEELRAYIREKGYAIDAQYFFDYYESVNWMRGKSKMKSWKLTLNTWHNRNTTNNYHATDPKQRQQEFVAFINDKLSTPDMPETDISGYC